MEAYWSKVAEGEKYRWEYCIAQPASRPYPVNPGTLYIIDGKRRALNSWADEAEMQRRTLQSTMQVIDDARRKKEAFQRRLIFPF